MEPVQTNGPGADVGADGVSPLGPGADVVGVSPVHPAGVSPLAHGVLMGYSCRACLRPGTRVVPNRLKYLRSPAVL